MRGLGRLASTSKPLTPSSTIYPLFISSSSSFSTAGGGGGGGGGGRGRGRGTVPHPPPSRVPGKPEFDTDTDSNTQQPNFFSPSPAGHGRGTPPIPSSPSSSWLSSIHPSVGRGGPHPSPPPPPPPIDSNSKKPIFLRRDTDTDIDTDTNTKPFPTPTHHSLPRNLPVNSLGAGRGKALTFPQSETPRVPVVEENRHLRPRSAPSSARHTGPSDGPPSPRPQRLSREEAVKKAREALSKDGTGGGRGGGRGRGRGMRGGRRGRGMGRAGRGGLDRDYIDETIDDSEHALHLGDNADGERLAKRLGPEKMNELTEAFEEMSWSALPSPMDQAYLDALNTNYMIEFEPEYLMEEFGMNPDIDDKPPIPLRDALEKMKPFLMAYEGIQSQEEWEEVMKETMDKVPLLKELVDYYSGPDRVTAKQQQQELERVAKTLPEDIPSSVKRFTDRAVLSLQSNPGWGFDKKCQFMDKLVWEVTQHYK